MIEASADTNVDVEERVNQGCPIPRSNRTKKHELSGRDVLDNTVMLVFDETLKNTLAHISYLLAVHPRIQLKLQHEIDTFYRENPVRR